MIGVRKGKIIKPFGDRAPGQTELRDAFLEGGWYIVSYNGSYDSLLKSYKALLKYKYGRTNIQIFHNYYTKGNQPKAQYVKIPPALAFKHMEEAVEYKLSNF